jgi:bacteriorhodopsin
MTILRLISPGLRSAFLLSAGLALISVPFMLGLEAAALTTALTVGVLMVALALAGTEPAGRGTLPVSAQAVYDRGLAIGLMAVAAIFALAGDLGATTVFATAGLATLVVTTITRYSSNPT